MVISVTN